MSSKGTVQILLCLCVVSCLQGCFFEDILDRARQLRTYTNMQAIVGRFEELRAASTSEISNKQIAGIIRSEANGRDEWGRPFIYSSRRGSGGFSYIVVSLGRDGKLDVSTIEEYYLAAPESIDGLPDRDIVFLDGRPLKNAGK